MPSQTDKDLWLTRWEIAKKRPWDFLKYFVFTLDEHDFSEHALMKPFPDKAMYRIIVRLWEEHNVLFIEKSRQIMMSWIMCALYLWLVMFHPAKRVFFQSKKQEDANALLDRARHIYENLIKLGLPGLPTPKMTGTKIGTSDKLEFPENKSEIWAIPQGPDIVRSYTCSGILADEDEHQPEFLDGYSAAMPTIRGGGRYTAQGTANGINDVYRILYGTDQKDRPRPFKLDSKDTTDKMFEPDEAMTDEEYREWIDRKLCSLSEQEFYDIPIEQLVSQCPGMRYWHTYNGGVSAQVHYSADPDKDPINKRGRRFVREGRAEMRNDAKWDQEMEMRRDVFAGRPVVWNWDEEVFVREFEPDPRYPLELSIDFGTSVCLCIIAQHPVIDDFGGRQVQILDEIVVKGGNTIQLATEIEDAMQTKYRRWWKTNHFRAYCDPAGNQGSSASDKSRRTDIEILADFGIDVESRKFGVPETTDMIETIFQVTLAKGEPAIIVHVRCTYLKQCYGGGLHYPDKGGKPGYYEKDGLFDHGGDATRYLLGNIIDSEHLTKRKETSLKDIKMQYLRRRYTGEIIGRRKTNRINPQRGTHAVRG